MPPFCFKLQGHKLNYMKQPKLKTVSSLILKYVQDHFKKTTFAHQTYLD